MQTALLVVAVVLVGLVVVLLVWLAGAVSTVRRDLAGQIASSGLLQQQIEGLKQSQQSLQQGLYQSLQSSQQSLTKSLQSSQQILSQLNTQIGQLQGSSQQMLRLGEQVRRLEQILSSPKLRGQMGEWSLENLLSRLLPAGSYRLQHSFRDGRVVDALIELADYSVAVDAKFPLPNFERMQQEQDPQMRSRFRRAFLKDVIGHIDKIAESYIRPAEGTLEFALMYIPAENVYYEAVVRYEQDEPDVVEYAMQKRVVPVSPNLLYVYLTTVAMGLHGLQIEQQARQIHENLQVLNSLYAGAMGSFDTLGTHLRKAQNKYDETRQRFEKLSGRLEQIQSQGEKVTDD